MIIIRKSYFSLTAYTSESCKKSLSSFKGKDFFIVVDICSHDGNLKYMIVTCFILQMKFLGE